METKTLPDAVKNTLIAALVALSLLIGALVVWLGGGGGDPIPAPSPSPSVIAPSPTAIPLPSPSLRRIRAALSGLQKPYPGAPLEFQDSLSLKGSRGETVGWIVEVADGDSISVPDPGTWGSVKVYSLPTVTTKIPSHNQVAAGTFYDPVVAATELKAGLYLLDFEIKRDAIPGTYSFSVSDLPVTLKVWKMTMPERPSVPAYMELQFAQVARAHNLADEGSTLKARADLNAQYRKMYRDHRVEPVKQAASDMSVASGFSIDNFKDYGASYRQTVIEGSIAAPCIFGPNPSTVPSATLLSQINQNISNGTLPAGSWIYAWDEGEGTTDAETAARVKVIKEGAPLAKIMVTRRPMASVVADQFYPVMDFWTQGMSVFGWYTSCMANATCQNTGTPGTPRGTPMMVVDSESVHQRAFPVITYWAGGKAMLYFNGTQMLPTAWTDQRNEGGNGDGTLVYPGPSASLRLKNWREGMFDVEYLAMSDQVWVKAELAKLITSPSNWNRNYLEWLKLRDLAGERLNSL
jgi:hypothetical protein